MSTTASASVLVLVTGIFWGIYWFPVRAIAELGLDGAWGTGAITLAATLFLFPFMLANNSSIREANLVGVASIALGGRHLPFTPLGFFTARLRLLSCFGSLAPSGAC
jgi:hypothetical protein